MKYILILLAFPLFSSTECGKKKNKEAIKDEQTQNGVSGNDSIPVCVKQFIDSAMKEKPPVPPVQVDEYIYNGKKVFLFTAPCCDFFNTVYDENCKMICSPTGGITGKGDGKCEDFGAKAKYIKLVWKNKEQ